MPAKKTKKARPSADRKRARAVAEDLLAFLDASPCAFHAVEALRERLEGAGFSELSERAPLEIEPDGRYYLVRNDAALLAFVVGTRPPSAVGFRLVGAHTDSPTFRVKPNPEVVADGLVHLGVEIYGGPIVVTWTDRDLGLCGRVVLKGRGDALETRLVKTAPIVCLPNAAIHMNRAANEEGLKLNAQTELTPLIGTVAEGVPEKDAVRKLLAKELRVRADRILDFDLFLYDAEPASFGGVNDEFIRAGRLDDLAMCHAAVTALIDGADTATAATRMAICYDSEEAGSQTSQGARSNLVPATLERIALALGDDREGYLAALAGSRLVSADNTHALHPGYAGASEPRHAPKLNGGPAIKIHANRAYATDAESAAMFEAACRKAKVTSQRFVNRSDTRSGGTIGSMAAAQLGIPAVDVGNPQYAMHSVREMCGTWDHDAMVRALGAFYGM
jgi:aspartyl aminopeptidase